MKPRTQQDYHRRIARVVEAILADPAAAHSVESLAAVAHLSPFHFHRIYRAMTGEGLAETVRRLRLAQAAHQLTRSTGAVTDAAFDAGYESPQAFSRAFRDFTGVSPSSFQTRQQELMMQQGTQASPLVDIVHIPPLEVLCLRHRGPIASIGQTYRRLYTLLEGAALGAALNSHIGMSYGDPEGGDSFHYFAGVIASEAIGPVAGLESIPIAGGLFASHRLTGPYALIGPAFKALFGGWLPRSGYEPDDRPALEFYRTPTNLGEHADAVTDLLIPIRKA